MTWNPKLHPRDPRNGEFTDHPGGGWLKKLDKSIGRSLGESDSEHRATVRAKSNDMTAKINAKNPVLAVVDMEQRDKTAKDKYDVRGTYVGEVMGEAVKTHATDRTMTDETGAWLPERDKLHRDIADELYRRADKVPNNREAVIAGGLGGAGKTTVLTKHAGIDPNNYLVLNPDDVKELMAERGLIPEVPGEKLSPMERVALVHEESSRITSLMADKAYRDGKNVMWDITMSSGGSVQKRIDALKAAGYSDIHGVFVDIPVEVSVKRALTRYRRGQEKYDQGKGLGGRFVPPAIIRAAQTRSGETVNRQVFDGLKGNFSDWSVFDNSVDGRAPVKLAGKTGRTPSGRASSGHSSSGFSGADQARVDELRDLRDSRRRGLTRRKGLTPAETNELAGLLDRRSGVRGG